MNYRGAPQVAPNAVQAATYNRTPKDAVSTSPAVATWL